MSQFQLETLVLQNDVDDAIDETIADVIEYLPLVLAAIAILVVGYAVGRILGGLVTRIVRRLGVDRHAADAAIGPAGAGDDAIARALGTIVAFYVYFVALYAAVAVLGIDRLSDLLSDIGEFLPVVLGALAILVIGFVAGRIVGDIVADLIGDVNVGRYLRDTPIEQYGDEEREFGRIVGTLVAYYVYLLTLLAVADVLQIDALSDLLDDFASYLPSLAAGLIVLLVGIWLAERVAEIVRESGTGRLIDLGAVATKVLIYFLTITIVLDTVGIDASPLTTLFTAFFVAFFGALALALAIGAGVALGLGGQNFVEANIDDWYRSATGDAEGDTDTEPLEE